MILVQGPKNNACNIISSCTSIYRKLFIIKIKKYGEYTNAHKKL